MEDLNVLVVMAHPDDAELRCFGTLCKYRDAGYECRVLILSSGENGISIEDKTFKGINAFERQERISETYNAFENSGIIVEALNFTDGNISFDKKTIFEIENRIRKYKPQIIITHYPDEYGVDHQDHYAVGRATINCASRMDFVKKIMLTEPLLTLRSRFIPNCFVDITEYFNSKADSLKHHHSQSGRYYLEREYHETKTNYYATSVGYSVARNGSKFEAFNLFYSLES